jgi:hypothetical protein
MQTPRKTTVVHAGEPSFVSAGVPMVLTHIGKETEPALTLVLRNPSLRWRKWPKTGSQAACVHRDAAFGKSSAMLTQSHLCALVSAASEKSPLNLRSRIKSAQGRCRSSHSAALNNWAHPSIAASAASRGERGDDRRLGTDDPFYSSSSIPTRNQRTNPSRKGVTS